MKIAITADPELPVPPLLYGGIERVIHMLVRGLVDRGHSVTLFAHRDSQVPCALVPYRGRRSGSPFHTLANMFDISRHAIADKFDVVHSFGRLAYLAPVLALPIPKLMTYQREISPSSVAWGHRLSRGTLHFSAISNGMMAGVRKLANWHLVFNGVPMHVYTFAETVGADAPLVFLGRVERIKGTHLAIEIARRAGRRLVIAGNVPEGQLEYFRTLIEPHIDGNQITYVGPVNDSQKNAILGSAAALLMPILWEEPFGIVMAEALACGTPVLGFRRGAVPEVVENGVSGFVADDVEGLAKSVSHIGRLNRADCRSRAQLLFSDDVVVRTYENIYKQLCDRR